MPSVPRFQCPPSSALGLCVLGIAIKSSKSFNFFALSFHYNLNTGMDGINEQRPAGYSARILRTPVVQTQSSGPLVT